MAAEFEQFARSVLASGCSARMARDNLLLTGQYLLPPNEADVFCRQVPQECESFPCLNVPHTLALTRMHPLAWYARQREALGLESYVYSFMKVASAREVLQWGFDETTLDGQVCPNPKPNPMSYPNP